jgi:hypothetical protein
MAVTISGATVVGGVNIGDYVPIVTSGLIARLDASNTSSYPGTGTTITDLSGQGATGTINGTVSFVSSGQASYWNFATSSDSNFISSTLSQSYVDCTFVLYPDFTANNGSALAGLISNSSPAAPTDKSLRFQGVNGVGPWTVADRNPGDPNDWAYPTRTNYYVNGSISNILVSGWNIFGGYRTNQSTFPLSFAYYLGSSGYPSRSFQGRIALALLYNRQLSDAEQVQNFTALRGRFGL